MLACEAVLLPTTTATVLVDRTVTAGTINPMLSINYVGELSNYSCPAQIPKIL